MGNLFKITIIGAIIVALIVATHYLGWLAPVEGLAVTAVSPLQRPVYALANGSRFFYSSWLMKRDLLAENDRLKNELKQSVLFEARINSLEEENKLLKKELGFSQEHQYKFVSAKIITGVSDPLSRSVIISRGQNNGVQKGMAVIADDGILVGKVYEVGETFSKVLLLTDNKSKAAATIQNRDQTIGLVEGQFGLSLLMTNIPQDEAVKSGDLVVTSGLEGLIPKNLIIARVEKINQVESEIFKSAVLSPIIPFDNLSDVLVIIP